ncbi:MAG: AAA family ATPase [Deltaproteobacteria bacterium]|jgi:SpoVK/Ycf46/Vps4 family AAA+-type ATPase|nr:AAA family ATPase [Deltaproteobacteria bacterium]
MARELFGTVRLFQGKFLPSWERQVVFYYLRRICAGSLNDHGKTGIFDYLNDHIGGEFLQKVNARFIDREQTSRVKDVIESHQNGWQWKARTVFLAIKAQLEEYPIGRSLSVLNPAVIRADRISREFNLTEEVDLEVIRLSVSVMIVETLSKLLSQVNLELNNFMPKRVSEILGLPLAKVVKSLAEKSPLITSGLFEVCESGKTRRFSEPFQRIVYQLGCSRRSPRSVVLGKKSVTALKRSDFDHQGNQFDFMAKLLAAALKEKKPGLNLLFYGPNGTGKTEMAKALCAHVGAKLYSVSEENLSSGTRNRLAEMRMAETLVSGDESTVLMMDEAEDVFGSFTGEVHFNGNSKLYINRLLERNFRPVIWITNDIYNMDRAFVRRFSYALEMSTPPTSVRKKIWQKVLNRKKISLKEDEVESLAQDYELPPSFTASAVQAAVLTKDGSAIRTTLDSLEKAVTGRKGVRASVSKERKFNLELVNAETDIIKLTDRIIKVGPGQFSICLYGPPGTGKSGYIKYLAKMMGLKFIQMRASDLISMWVGGTEANIAAAFQKAEKEKGFLIFDEADSFLQDRRSAVRSWEVTAVNEMLTWMENHPFPFACITNLINRLDQASLRRFTFKVRFDSLTQNQAKMAFAYFFGLNRQPTVKGLTPGDFAVVAKKADILKLDNPEELEKLLTEEVNVRGGVKGAMGFF